MTTLEQFAYDNRSSVKYAYILNDGRMGLFDKDLMHGNVFGDQQPFLFYDFINAHAHQSLDLSDTEIIRPIFRNEQFLTFLRMGSNMAQPAAQELGILQNNGRFQVFEDMYQNSLVPEYYAEMVQAIEEEWLDFEKQFNQEIENRAFVQSLDVTTTTPFREERYIKTFRVNVPQFHSVYDVFDQVNVNAQFPVVVLSEYYKILKGFEFSINRLPEQKNELWMYTSNVLQEPVKVHMDYDEKNATLFDITLDVDSKSLSTDTDQLLNSVCAFLGIEQQYTLVRTKFSGSFTVAQIYDTAIWMDVLMNNPIASTLFAIDEHVNATPKREAVFMYYLKHKTTLTIRSSQVNTLVKILNVDSMDVVIDIMNSVVVCFGIYLKTGRDIAKEYNILLKNVSVAFVSTSDESKDYYKQSLKETVPHIYGPNSSRQCAHLPRLLSDTETKTVDPERVLQFPKQAEGQPVYNFYCDHPVFKYPGLRTNHLANRKDFPVIPCCYKTSHRSQPLSNLNQYYGTDVLLRDLQLEGDRVISRKLLTQKILAQGQKGVAPTLVSELFQSVLDTAVDRMGVANGTHSFLECILFALDIDNFKKGTRSTLLEQQVQRLGHLDDAVLNVASQECWNQSSIRDRLRANNEYFDPRLFVRLVEYVYECRIVLFTTDNFVHPEYPMGKSEWKQSSKTPIVYIYEHYGGEFEHRSFPQCELIVTQRPMTVLDENALWEVYSQSLQSFDNQKKPQTFIPPFGDIEYTFNEQWIDYYGKVFGYTVLHRGRLTTLYCKQTVLPPHALPRATRTYDVVENNSLMVGGIEFYTLNKPPTQSIYRDFNRLQEQVDLLVENAKYMSRQVGDMGTFFNHVVIGDPMVYPKDTFVLDKYIRVPTLKVKNSLEYMVELFMLRHYKEWERMSARNYPEVYNSINKFRKSSEFVVASTESTIQWFTNKHTLRVPDRAYTHMFYCILQNTIFKAQPVVQLPTSNFLLVIPQRKNNVRVGEHIDSTHMLINDSGKNYYYALTPMNNQ
jgi:hypothetical protein